MFTRILVRFFFLSFVPSFIQVLFCTSSICLVQVAKYLTEKYTTLLTFQNLPIKSRILIFFSDLFICLWCLIFYITSKLTTPTFVVFTDYDECTSSPCFNGGTCKNGKRTFSCACPPTHKGRSCEGKLLFCRMGTFFFPSTCFHVSCYFAVLFPISRDYSFKIANDYCPSFTCNVLPDASNNLKELKTFKSLRCSAGVLLSYEMCLITIFFFLRRI